MPLVSLTPLGFYPRVILAPSMCLRVVFMSPSASIIYKTMVDAWITEMSVLICFCSRSESESCSVVSNSLRPHGLYSPWNSPGHNNGVGSQSLLRGSFQPKDQTQVSCTAGRFFNSCPLLLLLLSRVRLCATP